MPSETQDRRIPRRRVDQTGPREPGRLHAGDTDVPASPDGAAGGSYVSAHHLAGRQLLVEETAANLPEPDEVLIADARSGLSPAQMVDRKLLALMRGGSRGISSRQPAGRKTGG